MVLPHVVPAIAPQPGGVDWPTRAWPTGPAPAGIDALVDAAFSDPAMATTYAVVIVQGGLLVAERYGNALPSFTHAPTPVTAATPLLSWSMAKSVLHSAVGLLVADGVVDLDRPIGAPEWPDGDARAAITWRQCLQMRDGLAWREDYVDDTASDVIEMLFGAGKDDVAHFAAERELEAAPGTRFSYSSGTSNLLARAVGEAVGGGEAIARRLRDRLFAPIGMTEATIGLDAAGTFVGSSFAYATARSWARFATLYLRGGEWDGRRVLDRDWVDTAQVPTGADDDGTYYSHHWWLDAKGTYWASGYRGQRAIVVPALDAVVVRLGDTPQEGYDALAGWCASVIDALR